MSAFINGITSYLPNSVLDNIELAAKFPEWTEEKIYLKTGIKERKIAGKNEYASDLAFHAALALFDSGACKSSDIDAIVLCTQSPDYVLPTTACLLQHRLGISTHALAFDFNLGCSGYIYGLGICKGLLETGQASSVLLLTADTYSKYVGDDDQSVRTLFGDGATATYISNQKLDTGLCLNITGPFEYGTDGSGGTNLIVENSGSIKDESKNRSQMCNLYMNGPEIFTFTLRVIPTLITNLLKKANLSMDDIDLYVFHQANQYLLDHLRKKLKIPAEKFALSLEMTGNTVSSTIPIVLEAYQDRIEFCNAKKVMLVGFGVGYSWGGVIIDRVTL
jgi:3-oxoacyl-[acyl-carrier-protein] synthase-3